MANMKEVSYHIWNLWEELYQLKPLDNEAWLEWVEGIRSVHVASKLLDDLDGITVSSALSNMVAFGMVKWIRSHESPEPAKKLAEFAHDEGYWNLDNR